MSANNSTVAQQVSDYTCVRFYVSTVSFSVLLFFNLIINWTIVRVQRLRSHARFVLVFHLLVSALVHLGMSSVFYYQIHRDARPVRSACLAMITVLISSASNILLTLTVMALDRYCAVCHPMRYTSTCTSGRWPWLLGALTWVVALVIPLSLLLHPDSGDAGTGYDGVCGLEQLRKGQLQKVLFIGLCTLLILYSYVRILVEGRRLGVVNRRNRAGCRTIALHGSQLAVYILPNFVNFVLTVLIDQRLIQAETKELSAVVVFAFFSLAQCVAPVVYGLRKEELLEQLSHRFPCCSRYLKSFLGWSVRSNWPHTEHITRERTLTAQTIISLQVSQVPEEETRPLSIRSSSHDS
ncbi:odorant receptor 131-2 [Cyclopterus lumpus]|uniref:G-protein coupled receptors family 1 profile domain-containing protein n=1 Tax=Cyclopterus lumpus TaxID=8103 RepID=A0A8C3AIC7_CYCLU|nr:odorant receptor 131-2 [Cyclopterus lumpus]XP_034412526.1 odorant receptor 131-2 [Cyclopterus lumpus]XP_034412527.1 odorant receptor 131-2 [Cyclopterus lumpus]XP_034412528.1 odorant receptor 131-2 [Cyclopterus lumpus]XP_034412529.1 odorant receptor 131-2 [Cyclopterus lumpus]XP_034412530.1 odorant receptor 131-2 [Cyclopterus lumpus]